MLTGTPRIKRDTWLWVDAICIDQDNITERNQQVRLMRQVYQKCRCVLAWLGPPRKKSVEALAFIIDLGEAYGRTRSIDFVRQLLSDPRHESSWLALDRLFKRPWWQRVWIKQECVLPSDLVFVSGQQCCSLSQLYSAILCLSKALNFYTGLVQGTVPSNLETIDPKTGHKTTMMLGNQGYQGIQQVLRLRDFRTANDGLLLPFLSVLNETKDVASTDPRDQIYGLLGLAGDAEALVANPDYAAPVSSVFADLVKSYFSRYKNLDIVCFGPKPRVRSDLPSWVPGWSARTDRCRPVLALTRGRHQAYEVESKAPKPRAGSGPMVYNASSGCPPEVCFSEDLTVLTAAGAWIDDVDGLGWALALDTAPVDLVQSSSAVNTSRDTTDAFFDVAKRRDPQSDNH